VETPTAPADTPERLLRELTKFLSETGRDQPLLIVLEDLHWADAATTDVVTHLASRLSTMRVLLVVTYRDRETPPSGPPFARARAELRAKGLLREIALPLLTAQEVVHFVEKAGPAGVPASDLGMRVYASSEGNPLFMTALLSYLTETGIHSAPAAPLDSLPESLSGLITRALTRLDDAQRSVLEAAALQGYTVSRPDRSRCCSNARATMAARRSISPSPRSVRWNSLRSRTPMTLPYVACDAWLARPTSPVASAHESSVRCALRN
jgi:predicted ATPase